MQETLAFLIENPFAVVFGLFILSLISFFAFEIFAEHKRLEKHYHIKKIILGAFVIVLALCGLFLPYAGYGLKSSYPGGIDTHSVSDAQTICTNTEPTEEYKQGCFIITGIAYICYLLLFIGAALIIAGIVSIK